MGTEKPIIDKIEQCRKELIALTTRSSLISPDVIRASIALDVLLNEYEIYKKQNNSKR